MCPVPAGLVVPARPLVVIGPPARRFLSGLALISPHCVSSTVIQGGVLGSQAVHLQIGSAFRIISWDGESAFHRRSILCCVTVSFVSNKAYPLQSLSWSLADPAYIVVTERESRTFAGESQRSSRLPQVPTRLHQLHLTSDTCRQNKFISSGHTHTDTENSPVSL